MPRGLSPVVKKNKPRKQKMPWGCVPMAFNIELFAVSGKGLFFFEHRKKILIGTLICVRVMRFFLILDDGLL